MIIGITGTMAAGKGEVARILREKFDFTNFSCSDVIREELKKRGIAESRDTLREMGNELRSTYGPQILAERIYDKILFDKEKDYSVDSIRNPSEVDFFKENAQDFILIYVDAPIEVRYQRAKIRGRLDGKTFEDFKHKEELEKSDDKNNQQLHVMERMADVKLFNDKSLKDLEKELKRVIKRGN